MITTILVAIIGYKVFPDQLGWWIAYCIFGFCLNTFTFLYRFMKELSK